MHKMTMCFIITSTLNPEEKFRGTILGKEFSLEKSKGRDVTWISGATSSNSQISDKITWSGRVERLKIGFANGKVKITPLWVNPKDDDDNRTAWRELKRLGLKHEYDLPLDYLELTKRQILHRVLSDSFTWQNVNEEWQSRKILQPCLD
ncbi:MAG TPA: hypothetical protein VFF13_06095 [archaeon]|nr:hypothetical protein [archaeon]